MSTGSMAGRPGKTFSADVTAPGSAREGFDVFRREWDVQVGEAWPLPLPDIGECSSSDGAVITAEGPKPLKATTDLAPL
jgi:hypothetical protein